MNKFLVVILLLIPALGMAAACPSPNALNPLPVPWQEVPFSTKPTDLSNLRWIRAKILYNHAGVTCTYQYDQDKEYTIWWYEPYIKPNHPKKWYDDHFISWICSEDIFACSFEILH